MRVFFDSSSLTKRYLYENGSDRVVELFEIAEKVVVCTIAYSEVLSAFNRGKRAGDFPAAKYKKAKAFFTEEFLEMDIIPVDTKLALKTDSLLEESVLRGMDSLHIASALDAKVDLFVSSDKKQIEAAVKAGLKVESVAC
jgi:hypothetical protein